MLERILLLAGGVEITIGGLMTAYPLLFPQWIGLLMAAVGVITTLCALWMFATDFRKTGGIRVGLVPQWSFQFNDLVPFRRTIPLSKAAQYVRDRTLGTPFARSAEKLSSGAALSWIATSLAMYASMDDDRFPGPLRLYGRPPGATRRVLIPDGDRKTGHLIQEGDEVVLKEVWNDTILYSHLEILRSEMKKRLRYLRSMNIGP